MNKFDKGSSDFPKCPEGYVFLCGVFEASDYSQLGYKTAILGPVMYNKEGEELPEQYPVFVTKEEFDVNSLR